MMARSIKTSKPRRTVGGYQAAFAMQAQVRHSGLTYPQYPGDHILMLSLMTSNHYCYASSQPCHSRAEHGQHPDAQVVMPSLVGQTILATEVDSCAILEQ